MTRIWIFKRAAVEALTRASRENLLSFPPSRSFGRGHVRSAGALVPLEAHSKFQLFCGSREAAPSSFQVRRFVFGISQRRPNVSIGLGGVYSAVRRLQPLRY